MYNVIVVFHVALALILIVSIVLFQTSKGSALSMFGGGGDSLFNAASGTSFIKKFTSVVAILLATTSLLLAVYGSRQRFRSVVQEYPMQAQPAQQGAPVQPAAPAAPVKPAPAPAKK